MGTATYSGFLQKLAHDTGAAPDNPILLICDGAPTRFDLDMLKLAKSLGILLLVLPSNLTWLLQPLDVRLFLPFKQALDELIDEYQRPRAVLLPRICSCARGALHRCAPKRSSARLARTRFATRSA